MCHSTGTDKLGIVVMPLERTSAVAMYWTLPEIPGQDSGSEN